MIQKDIAYGNIELDGIYEEIGDSLQLEDYTDFLSDIGLDDESLSPTLVVDSFRRLFTIIVNGQPIDISFNVSSYQNCIYEMPGCIRTIEIRPRDNQIIGRLTLLEIKKKLEEAFPILRDLNSNANIYEIGMADSYDKYKKGYIISEDAQDFERSHPDTVQRLNQIIEDVKSKRKMVYITSTLPAKEFMKQNKLKIFPSAPDDQEL